MTNNAPTQAIRVLLDTNILLDLVIQRQLWLAQAQPMWDAWNVGKLTLSTATVSLTTISYVAYKPVGYEGVITALRWCAANLELVNVTKTDVKAALKMPGPDFEDNVQIACAKRAKCAYIVTRNPHDFANSPIPVVDPVQLMQSLPA